MATKTPRQRLEQLVKTFERIARESSDAAVELQNILDTKPSNGQAAKNLLDLFATRWEARYRTKFVTNGAKDMSIFKRLLKSIDANEIDTRQGKYMVDLDPFLVEARHPIGLFATRINAYGSTKAAAPQQRAVNCKHVPPCTSDVAHTAKRTAEEKNR